MKDILAKLYVFGSCLRNDGPNDIDLLWVYNKNMFNTQQALEFVNKQATHLQLLTSISIHNTILSDSEENSVHFIDAVEAQCLYSWTTKERDIDYDEMARIDSIRRETRLQAILNTTQRKQGGTI